MNCDDMVVSLYSSFSQYGNMGCRDFKGKDTKLDRFLAKINILKENYCTELVNDHNGKLSKSAKI